MGGGSVSDPVPTCMWCAVGNPALANAILARLIETDTEPGRVAEDSSGETPSTEPPTAGAD